MSITLLLDLDDTLLDNDIDKFLPVYLKALGVHLSGKVPADKMVPQLLAATGKMIANTDPSKILEEVFDADFYPKLGVTKAELADTLADFYEDVFPTLSYLTRPRQQAVRVVEEAFDRGWQVVIATNPLFPRRAIEHRLDWAGLPVSRFPFSLITSYELMHFAKPATAYYAEVLAHIGWLNQPAVMVGNSLEDDLLPAARLGIPGFWLTQEQAPLPEDAALFSRRGQLADLPGWLTKILSEGPKLAFQTPQALLSVLLSTPAVLDTMLRAAPPSHWNNNPQPGEWCFTEIICHLRDSDREVNLQRLERILAEENAFFAAVNADAWSDTRSYCSEDAHVALAGFIESRVDLVKRLEMLPAEAWQRSARHAIFGPTDLIELIGFIASHDRTHIQQALQTLQDQIKQS
jgi:FMN phosphatase YigB (HAD superfamily)